MKLRNKKTGEIIDPKRQVLALIVVRTDDREVDGYGSIAELNEEWEDYTPKEPLIKDEKKLDTVKSFFALLGITKEIYYQTINNCFYHTDDDGISYGIDFGDDNGIDNIDTNRAYTVAELCGEADE